MDRRYRWTGRLAAGLGAYVVAMAVLVVGLSGDVRSSRAWFFVVATLGALFVAAAAVSRRRR